MSVEEYNYYITEFPKHIKELQSQKIQVRNNRDENEQVKDIEFDTVDLKIQTVQIQSEAFVYKSSIKWTDNCCIIN